MRDRMVCGRRVVSVDSARECTYWISLINMLSLILLCAVVAVQCDVHETTTEIQGPPRPYLFSYTAGRFPGHTDRQHSEVSNGEVVRGTYSYVDPRQEVRTVDYIADKEGFHPVLSHVQADHPADSAAVAHAKDRHYQLYAKIAEDHATRPHPDESSVPRQSEAVALAAARHAQLFRVIAEQHARIAAERDALQREEEEKQHLQDLHDQ